MCLLTCVLLIVIIIKASGIFRQDQALTPSISFVINETYCKGIEPPVVKEIRSKVEFEVNEYLMIFQVPKNKDESDQEADDSYMCVPYKTTLGMTPIFIYDPKKDLHVSRWIAQEAIWEELNVHTMTSFLQENKDMQLFDIGCNIGAFTLQAAKMGRKVLAIDANEFNLRLLSKSLNLGGLQKNVTLLWNAVSDVHETIKLTITAGNIGGSFVNSKQEVGSQAVSTLPTKTALAITLEDLIKFANGKPVFIKIDIEGSEWKAFRGGERFFKEVDVRYILMEWMTYASSDRGQVVVMFMSNLRFVPYAVHNTLKQKLAVSNYQTWPDNVLWVKK